MAIPKKTAPQLAFVVLASLLVLAGLACGLSKANSSVSDKAKTAAPSLTLTAPNGGEFWPAGGQGHIRWTTLGTVSQVSLAYSSDGFATSQVITASMSNSGVYTWTMPLTPTTSARVRVASVLSPTTVYDDSDADFTLYDPGAFTHTVYSPTILKDYNAAYTDRIQPEDLTYLGTFRLPDYEPEEVGWAYSGAAMAYHPDGDPGGPADGFPGSIFGTGHNWNQYVSEIDIPIPLVSLSKDVSELNTARTLQNFADIRGGLFGALEIPRVGLEYLPAQGEQSTGKLYFCWAQHMGEGDTNPSHGWSELTLDTPNTAGAWRISEYWNYVTTDYIFAIPQAWADAYTPGMYLVTGRFRDGGQGSLGPTLFAYGPWNHGNPPAADSTLMATPLLLYGNVYQENPPEMSDYHHSDEWTGGAWLTAGDKAAVVFVGTKGQGECWYGCSDGTVWPDEPPYPPECPERGWWSTRFVGQIIFYDPADLAAVAQGEMKTYEPKPYATLNIDSHLYHIMGEQQKHHVGAASFDRERGLLYVFEPQADGDKSLIHVWRVG